MQVIGLSVQDDDSTRQAMLDAGVATFVSKSDDAGMMIQAVLDVWASRQE